MLTDLLETVPEEDLDVVVEKSRGIRCFEMKPKTANMVITLDLYLVFAQWLVFWETL